MIMISLIVAIMAIVMAFVFAEKQDKTLAYVWSFVAVVWMANFVVRAIGLQL